MTPFLRAVYLGALILALATFAQAAAAKTILVFSPHPDDEALVAAGHVRAALAAGHTVKIVVVTNGDFQGVQAGLMRQGESVAAAQILGLTEQDVIFLGYPDGALMQIYGAPSPTEIVTSNAGQTQTYGSRGLGGMDYHRFRFGAPGAYNRVTLEQDIRTLLDEYRPDEIYTVSHFDMHPDHQATAILVTEGLVALKRSGVALATRLHQGIVWTPSQDNWPDAGGCSPDTAFPPPQMETPLEWKRLLRAVVAANLKCQAIAAFSSQATPHLLSFARKDEFFWVNDFGANLALSAQVTASSENIGQSRLKAVDGLVDGAHRDPAREWVSAGELAGAWIQLDWSAPASVSQVNLHDRPLGSENVLAGTLSFSDGTSIAVGALPADGKLLPVTFAPKTVTWVRFTIDQAQGGAAGLAEIQVLGVVPAQAAANVAPHFLEGPGGNSDRAIISSETATFSVQAHDLDGDALQYEWSADGGTIQGSGASAVFTPPAVTASTLFTITARILDGRGGSASSVGFVTVAPAVDALALSPTSVLGGGSVQGTVTLAAVAPGGGLSVPLSSSNPAATVPASVTVPAGMAAVSFPIGTSVVGARTDVTISANIRGTLRSALLAVTPQPSPVPPQNLLLSPDGIGDANWLNLGPIRSTLQFAVAPDGTQNASRVETTAPGGHALAQVVAVAANASYTFSFHARNNGGSAAAYSVHCASLGTDIIPATPYVAGINGSTWTLLSATFTTPAGCTEIVVYPVRDSGAPVDVLLWRATLVPSGVAVPPVLSSIGLSAASVTGGGTVTGTATLSAAAPAGGAQVALSSNSAAAAVPSSVTIPAGATSATFSVTTSAVAAAASVTISGSYGGATQAGSLTVLAPRVGSLSLSTSSVTGGSPATGTVTLDGPAPAGGAQVALSSNNPAASVAASVTVAAGSTSATFSIATSPVAASSAASLSASYGGGTQSVSLTVLPPAVSALNVSLASVTGGTAVSATVTLNAPAPAGGAQVTLSDNSGAASVPASVTVPAGATSASFSVGTSAVASSSAVTISASYGGASRTALLTVLPAVLTSLTVNPTSVLGLLQSATGTVTLNGPAPAGGAIVTLTDNSGACSRPGSVTIPAGATSATFTVTTGLVLVTTTCTVTGTYQGTSRSANLQVTL
jgi:LmbE family N-acetylglucosaminyl deacetylase